LLNIVKKINSECKYCEYWDSESGCGDIDGARGMPTGYNCPSNRNKSIGEIFCGSKKKWLNLNKKMNKHRAKR
jgi:hypothetical protein